MRWFMYSFFILLGGTISLHAQLTPITKVTLTFTADGMQPVVAEAVDRDGGGLVADSSINLLESTEYTLEITLSDTASMLDINAEVLANADRYQFFFAGSETILNDSPTYTDTDGNGLPIGLTTSITTSCVDEGIVGDSLLVTLNDLMMSKSMQTTIDSGVQILNVSWMVSLANDPEAPACENEEEIITDVILSWVPTAGGDTIVARAQDPDGEGPQDLQILNDIDLLEGTDYNLHIALRNEIEGEDITEEIMEEDDEHMFFFSFGDELFLDPDGDGNIDNRTDALNYNDMDENGFPVGLSTNWTTECGEETTTGDFRLILKHQPDVKSATSTAEDGGTDLDLTFIVNVGEDPEAPPCENEEEIITDVILRWIPTAGGDTIMARAQDPDGEGPQDLQILDEINLLESTDYNLHIEVRNEIEGEDITEEIREEDDEHMFFFSFTEGIFSDPSGDGNVDSRSDTIRYNDRDENNLPVGLSTSWTTATAMTGGDFRLVLKHQPDIKSPTSTAEDGGTDLDLIWKINNVVTSSREFEILDPSKLVLAPNPVEDELQMILDTDLQSQGAKISIYHVSGQLMQLFPNFEPTIDVGHLASGIYLAQYIYGKKLIVKKFVKN